MGAVLTRNIRSSALCPILRHSEGWVEVPKELRLSASSRAGAHATRVSQAIHTVVAFHAFSWTFSQTAPGKPGCFIALVSGRKRNLSCRNRFFTGRRDAAGSGGRCSSRSCPHLEYSTLFRSPRWFVHILSGSRFHEIARCGTEINGPSPAIGCHIDREEIERGTLLPLGCPISRSAATT